MKYTISVCTAVACMFSWSSASNASPFTGYSETADFFYDDAATFDYDPAFLGGSIFDFAGLVDLSLSTDFGSGSLLLTDNFFSTVLDGSLLDTVLSVDDDIGDDTFSMLFGLTTGSTDYAIATFTGDLDGFGFTDFFNDGVLFADGSLKIVGARQDNAAVVPLPAGLPLLLTGMAGIAWMQRRRRE